MRRRALWTVLLGLFGTSMLGQQVANVRVIEARQAASGGWELLVNVSDATGRRIDGLGPANFTGTLAGQRVIPDSVERVDDTGTPMSVILLLDVSGSMHRSIVAVRDAAAAFVQRLGPKDSCSLITFGDGVKTIAGFTDDKGQLLHLLEDLEARDAKTYLYQAVDDALNLAAVSPSSRAAIVLMTDGHDEGSALTAEDVRRKLSRSEYQFIPLRLAIGPTWVCSGD